MPRLDVPSYFACLAARCCLRTGRHRRRRLCRIRALRLQSLRLQQPPAAAAPTDRLDRAASAPRRSTSMRSRCRRRAGRRPSPLERRRDGAQGLGAYRPGERRLSPARCRRRMPTPPPRRPPAIGPGTAVAGHRRPRRNGRNIARKYGVPASAIMQTNGIRDARVDPAGPAPGDPALRLGGARHARAAAPRRAVAAPRKARRRSVHIVEPGETSDRHRAPARRDAEGAGARQQHPALYQDQLSAIV